MHVPGIADFDLGPGVLQVALHQRCCWMQTRLRGLRKNGVHARSRLLLLTCVRMAGNPLLGSMQTGVLDLGCQLCTAAVMKWA